MEKGKQSKLQFRIDIVLTVLFLITIFYILFGTIVFEQGLFGHAFYIHYVGEYLEDRFNYTPWEWLEASIHSLDNFISQNLHGTSVLGQVNSTFQYALGKKLVSTGGAQMIRLNSGHLYDLTDEMSMAEGRDDILRLKSVVPEGTPFVFVYEHPTLYDEEAQMPEGYEFMDFTEQEADEIVTMLRDSGVDVIDSRDVMKASGAALEDFLMYTDQHWASRASLTVAQAIAERAEELTGVDMPSELLDIEQFDTEVYPKLFLGKYGQRVGTLVIDPDDITVFNPKYETNIHRVTSHRGNVTEAEGPFETVNLNRSALVPDEGKSWNIRAYTDYGLTEDYEIFTNPAGGDCSILLVKDSFSASVGRFLSLVANEVYSVELRSYYAGTLSEWIEKYDPDIVVVAYSLQMLRNESYVFE